MENLEVLVRGVVMQKAGLQQGSVIFQGMELLWVLVVATIVLAVVSVTRVSVVSVGWTWGSKPGHVRVRVESFLADGALVGSPAGMFSAEILNCSADSCSEDASSSAGCGEKRAEMVFIFDENGASLVTRATTTTTATVLQQPQLLSHAPPAPRAAPDKIITRTQPKAQEIQTHEEMPLVSTAQLIEGAISLPRREGIGWDFTSPTNSLVSSSGYGLAKPLAAPFVSRAPSSPLLLRAVRNRSASACEWDALLKLRMRDAVLSDGGSGNFTVPLAPVAIHGSSSAVMTLKDEVVRVWDTDSKSLLKSVRLPSEGDTVATAFDVNWEWKLVAMARKGGVIAVANLECGAYEERFQTQQPVVHAIHVDRASLSKTLFTGGPASAYPGCSVSIYDCRSSTRQQLSLHLPTTTAIYDLQSHDHNLYLRDRSNSLAAHDVRMLKPYPVNRLPCRVPDIATRDRWWDNIDHIISQGNLEEEDDDDDDDDLSTPFDCSTTEGGASNMGRNFVIGVRRSFCIKPPSH